ncbi:bifunctional ornithine acetyltransferase/N-acetylglutamate synthase [Helicobacter bilis]|uniref:Arginine biosynthesis bifunctional protein ArgJ n=2 Tax=Helicobacter bilis TaxID=37372 RepID=A0A6D2CG68_9HELI|nr:bifunctional ornithine acetyltransferase/N-acetylglutamate synthase [Helicobacter bilis]EMZ39307.1 glutamate N-acetyltransferase/amino-acid acetyltransferase [Helicobacter bilis WiWa]TLE05225.1 bifunctional ornithine acetyltransferase/N-acetylglutamate synthase [Helicobacter bilis]TLE06378.1 bifunctional ornithine acetyltransferase/N-acetylglutamate synthase [Helicobacter bilis]
MATQIKLKAKRSTKLPKGFKLSGVKANIKYKNRLDLALIYSQEPCQSAGVWTKNSVQAACITHNKAKIQNHIHAVMINSGCANACTGKQGEENCDKSAEALAKVLRIDSKHILLASTGVIGAQLPMPRILKAIPKLVAQKNSNKDSIKLASKAIMTTDTFPKTFGITCKLQSPNDLDSKNTESGKEKAARNEKTSDSKNIVINTESKENAKDSISIENKLDSKTQEKETCNEKAKTEKKNNKFRIFGMAKGSGMIHPNMATMLGFILTDIAISKELLQEALSEINTQTFNQISVDGDTSTNDMVVVLANGAAKNEIISSKSTDYEIFKKALKKVCVNLAKQIAKDGEGATHLLEVSIKNAQSLQQAQTLSKAIIGSNLVKTAIFGKDANWGRIICAMGYSNASFDASKFNLIFASKKGKIIIVKDGVGTAFNENKAKSILSADVVRILIDLQDGTHSAKAWGCDLSYDYIKINADYRS